MVVSVVVTVVEVVTFRCVASRARPPRLEEAPREDPTPPTATTAHPTGRRSTLGGRHPAAVTGVAAVYGSQAKYGVRKEK